MEIPHGWSKPEAIGKVCKLESLFMGLNSPLEHGLIDLDEHCVIWGTNSAMEIILCSIDIQDIKLQCWLCMWMILLSQVMMRKRLEI